MRRHVKAPSAGSMSGNGGSRTRKSLFGMACVCVLGLTAFLGSGAPSAGAAGESCPNAAFRQGAAAGLPECRAYEQVSPVDKNSQDVTGATADGDPEGVAEDGGAVLYSSIGAFAGHPHGGSALGSTNYYFAQAASGNWATTPAIPRPRGANSRSVLAATPDLSASVLFAYSMAFEPDPEPPENWSNYSLRHNPSGETELFLSTPTTLSSSWVAGSSGFEHLAFNSGDELVSDPGAPPSPTLKVYDSTDTGISLVSRQPETNEPFTADAALGGYGSAQAKSGLIASGTFSSGNIGAVSGDGSRIFFEVPVETSGFASLPTTATVYRRDNGTSTELASPSQRTSTDPKGPLAKVFQRATPEGDRIFFTSAELLTDDANTGPERKGNDLYRYDMVTDDLIDVSATPGGDGANVVGVVDASENGDSIYYVARGEVVPGQGTPGEPNLYLWEDDGTASGATRYIATFIEGGFGEILDDSNWYSSNAKTSRVTSDGRFLLFDSETDIPGFDNGGTSQVYRYDAAADGGSGELICVSCNPGGGPPLGPSEVPTGTVMPPRALSEDGHVFFDSDDALLAADTNGRTDAYMWFEGQLHLLSTGTSTGNSRFYGASTDGRKAFFVTRDALVPQDADFNDDIYSATVDGGLAAQFASPPPSCAGEECRGAGSQPPAPQSPLTPSFVGAGNKSTTPSKRCAKGKRTVKARSGKTRCVKRHKKAQSNRNSSKTGRASR